MKNTSKVSLVLLTIAALSLIAFALAGKFEITSPVGTHPHAAANSLHCLFSILLALCVAPIVTILWRQGVFSKVPGLDAFTPIDAGCANNPQDKRTFDDVAGCEEAIAKLRRVARWLKSPEWYEQFGAKIPKGILAVGPPGTGKTLLARALAGEVDANFFAVHGSSFVEMFVGVGARRVRRLFAAAVAAHKRTGKPSIIFIDEIDAIGKKRGQGGSGADSERDQTLNQLLVCMQGFEATTGIIVMAATNMPAALDEALKRPGRFDYQVSVDLPDTLGREKIFSIHTRNMKLASNIRLRDLAIRTPQFSGADIEQACNEAAISAAERLEMSHAGLCQHDAARLRFATDQHDAARQHGAACHHDSAHQHGAACHHDSAHQHGAACHHDSAHQHGAACHHDAAHAELVLTLEDFDKGIDYVQFGDPMLSRARSMSQEDKRNTAFHEAGHCAVQQALQAHGADPITKVTIEPRTKSLGMMQSHTDGDRYCYTEEQLLARIATAMGGRAAQEHFLGRKDTGASNDFEQATRLAKLMVTEFGMSRLEPMLVKTTLDSHSTRIGDDLINEIDNEWRRILAEGHRRAMALVIENERRVERIAEALLAEQTLLGERFLELWGNDEQKVSPTERAMVCVTDAGTEFPGRGG